MKKILGIGELVWDVFPEGKQLGGAPVNFAFFAKELGAEAYPVAALGTDGLGDEAIQMLKPSGLSLDFIQRNSLDTSRVMVTTDENGVPHYEIVENVAWDAMECNTEVLALASEADVICWGSLAQRSEKSRESILAMVDAAPENCLRVFDINLRQKFYSKEVIEESLKRADILKLNEDELPVVSEIFAVEGSEADQIAHIIKRFSLRSIIYTQGAVCSEVYDASGLVSRMDTPKVKVADTVGAGDSFTATYVTSILLGKTPAQAHELAVKVAAFVCTQNGAINPLPSEYL
jgi:fructokinase